MINSKILKLIYNRYVFIPFLLILLTPAFAMHPYTPRIEDPLLEQWRWTNFTELNGKGLRCLVEDQEGVMWFGIDRGIMSYDGYNWEQYDSTNGFINAPVNALCASRDGSIYTGTDSGLFVFRNGALKSLSDELAAIKLNVHSIIELSDNSILAGADEGLLRIQKERLIFYTSHSEIKEQALKEVEVHLIPDEYTVASRFIIQDIMEDKNHTVWLTVGYDHGLSGKTIHCRYTGQPSDDLSFSVFYSEKQDDRYYNGSRIIEASDGKVWLINNSVDHELVYFDGKKTITYSVGKQFGEEDIYNSILQSTDGKIWIGGLGKIFTLKNNQWKIYRSSEIPIPFSTRIILFETSDGNLWIAGKQNEVFRFNNNYNNWATYCGLNFECETADGILWFLTVEGRAVAKTGDKWWSYGKEDGLIEAPVRLFVTRDNELWAAGSHNGIAATAYLKEKKWYRQLHPKLSWNVDYRAVFEDRDGSLWFGGNVDINVKKGQLGGTVCLKNPLINKNNFIHYRGIQDEIGAYGLGQSKDGQMWMAGVNTCYLEDDDWQIVTKPQELTYHTDYICSSEEGILWVGSRNYGVFRFDGENWKNYTISEGLESNSITFILPESENCVLIATDKSICKFDGKSWTNQIFPEKLSIMKEGGSIRQSSGSVLWINKTSREWNRRALTGNRTISKDFINYRCIYYKKDHLPPKTYISVYEEQVYQPGNTIISWYSIDPWSTTPVEKLQYSYRMDMGTWSPFSYQTNNIFLSLNDGDHIFEVRSRDLDDNIDPHPAIVSFNVAPPFYLQPAFYLPMITLSIIILLLQTRVVRRGRKLRLAKRETDNILHNVEEGLVLINKDIRIGTQYSIISEKILHENTLIHRNLLEILKDKINDDTLATARTFLDLIFEKSHDPEMMDDLNPLSEVKLDFGPDRMPKYLAFKFRKIETGKDQDREIFVTIKDITEQTILEQKLKESHDAAKRQMDWILSILHVDPPMLQEFIITAEREVKFIEELFSNIKKKTDYKELLEKIYRSMHLMKGNASFLALKIFTEKAHKIEDRISELQNKEVIKITDLNGLRDEVVKVKDTLNEVNNLLERIGKIHEQMRPKRSYEYKMMMQSFNDLITQMSEEEYKKTQFKHTKFKIEQIPHKDRILVKEVLIQMIRNSIAHGIEPVEERKRKNKPEMAQIDVSTFSDSDSFGFIIRDDGRGIQIEKLREIALKTGKWDNNELAAWNDNDFVNLLFKSGISTSNKVNMISGRGVGMDIVKEKIDSRNGTIDVTFAPDQYCEFKVTLPRST